MKKSILVFGLFILSSAALAQQGATFCEPGDQAVSEPVCTEIATYTPGPPFPVCWNYTECEVECLSFSLGGVYTVTQIFNLRRVRCN